MCKCMCMSFPKQLQAWSRLGAFDPNHTVQPRALKLWHNIPHLTILVKLVFRVLDLFLFFKDFSVTRKINAKHILQTNKYVIVK